MNQAHNLKAAGSNPVRAWSSEQLQRTSTQSRAAGPPQYLETKPARGSWFFVFKAQIVRVFHTIFLLNNSAVKMNLNLFVRYVSSVKLILKKSLTL